MLFGTNKPIVNGYSSWIDEASVGWREEIDCLKWIFKLNVDDFWWVIEYVCDVISMFYNHIEMK